MQDEQEVREIQDGGDRISRGNYEKREDSDAEQEVESFQDASEIGSLYPEDGDHDEYEDALEDVSPEELESRREKAMKLKDEGNLAFKEGNFEVALDLYSQGLLSCPLSCKPERSVLYSNRAAALFHLIPEEDPQQKDGNDKMSSPRIKAKENVISDCTQAIALNPLYLKPLIKRAEVYRDFDDTESKLDECLADYKKILELNPPNSNSNEIRQVIRELEVKIEKRNERLKQEMMSKLKDLGNLVLRPFGLSTNNFEMKPNESGGYSLNFKSKNNQ